MTQQELQQTLGQNIRKFRRQRGLTQESLADTVGISTPYCAQLETGHRLMRLPVLCRMSTALAVPIDVLVYGWTRNATMEYLVKSCADLSPDELRKVAGFVSLLRNDRVPLYE